MIRSFKCKDASKILNSQPTARFANIQTAVRRRLRYLNDAASLAELSAYPGLRLEKLTGNRAGQFSIRINAQWRICFVWTSAGPERVEIVDYH